MRTRIILITGLVATAAIAGVLAVTLAIVLTSNGSDDSDEAQADELKATGCEDYNAWRDMAYDSPLGMGAGKAGTTAYLAHQDELHALEDKTKTSIDAAAKEDSSWVPVQEAYREYVLAMIGYSPVVDLAGPEAAETRKDSSTTIDSACARL